MHPVNFSEVNVELKRPPGMTDEECGPLPVWTDNKQCVSCWQMSWRERISALVFGRVWLFVFWGSTQPPVYLEAKRTVFKTEELANG